MDNEPDSNFEEKMFEAFEQHLMDEYADDEDEDYPHKETPEQYQIRMNIMRLKNR